MKKQNKKNYIWNSIGNSTWALTSLILLIIVTRINGIQIAGIFSFAFALSMIIHAIAIYGGRIYQVSDIKKEFNDSNYISSRIITSLFSFVLIFLFCLIFKYDIQKTNLILILVLIRMSEVLSDSFYGIFQKNNRLDYVGISMAIKTIFGIIFFTIINLIFNDVVISALTMLFVNIICFIFYDLPKIKSYEKIEIKFNKIIISILITNFFVFLANLLLNINANVFRFIVEINLNDEMLGYFGIMIMIATVMLLMSQFLFQPMILELTKLFNSKNMKKFNKKFVNIGIFTVLLGLLCVLGVYITGPWILKIIYNLDFSIYRILLVFIVIGGTLNALTVMITSVLTIFRKTKIQFCLYLITLFFAILCGWYLFNLLNFHGIILSYLITMLFQFTIFLISYIKIFKKIK